MRRQSRRTIRTIMVLASICCLQQPLSWSISAQTTYAVVADLVSVGAYQPLGGLVRGSDGALYGTTFEGGTSCGTVYRLALNGDLDVIHSFNQPQGCHPVGDLAIGPDGSLYGITYYGGALGIGTVFKVAIDGSGFEVLHQFAGGSEGAYPYASLTFAPNGLFYGSTTSGIIFTISPQGDFDILATNLPNPQGALTLGSDGNLYGTASGFGSSSGAGYVFTMGLTGGLTAIHGFPYNSTSQLCAEGSEPLGELVEASAGVFYGTTSACGPSAGDSGTIFRVNSGGELTILHVLSSDPGTTTYSQGASPWAGLTLGTDGNLYGIATAGGAGLNGGIFRMTPAGSYTLLHSFDGTDGSGSQEDSPLEVSPGVFYGTTAGGKVYRLSVDVNSAPVAQNNSVSTTEDVSVSGTLGASDVDTDPLIFSIVTNGTLGTATLIDASTGEFTYTPNPNADGTDTFTFTANDGTVDSNVATVTVTITAINDAPVALNASIETNENTPISGTLVATDVDGPVLSFAILASGSRGTAVITNSATGAFTYTPNPGASGNDSFTFRVSDGFVMSNVATVSVAIAAVNQAPVARTGVVTTSEGTAVNGTLGATDPDGDSLTFSLPSQPAQGAVVLTDASTGTFTYTPNPGAIGYDTFAYTTQDAGGASATGTQMVFIVASSPRWPGQTAWVSVGPAALQGNGPSGEARASADGRYVVFSSDASNLVTGDTNGQTDIFVHDRQSGTTTRVSVATGGAQADFGSTVPAISADGRYVAFESQALNLAPGGTFGGTRLFVHDRHTGETTLISVAPDGSPANADSRRAALSGDGRYIAFDSGASNLVAGDANGARDVFVYDRSTGTTARLSVASDGTQGNGGSSVPAISADGRYVAFQSSATNLVAGDTNARVDVFVHDRVTGTTTRVSQSSAGIQGDAGSTAPQLSADGRYVVFESAATTLVGGDTNLVGDIFLHDRTVATTTRLSVSSGGGQGNGASQAPSISADGRYVAFTSASSSFSPIISNTSPVFVRDRQTSTTRMVSVASDGSHSLASAFGQISADGRFIALASTAANLVSGDSNGASDVFVVGGVTVTPTIASAAGAGATGTVDVTFVYPGTAWTATSLVPWIVATSQSSATANGTVTYTVVPNPAGTPRTGTLIVSLQPVTIAQGAATAPAAQNTTVATTEDTPAGGSLTATDPNGDALTYAIVSNGALGTAVVTNAATGAFTYTPDLNAFGTDTFTFQASDGTEASNVATVTVTVAPVNDAPVAASHTITTTEDTPASSTLPASDVDGPTLTFTIVTNGTRGTATITNGASGAFTYSPNPNANGSDSVTFQVSDGLLTSNVATVSVTVTPVNDAPVPQTGVVTTPEGVAVSGDLAATDPESGPVTFALATQAAQGAVILTDASAGTFTYTPNAGAIGYDSFTFTAQDTSGSSATGTQMVFVVASSPQWPGQTVRVSVASDGAQADDATGGGKLSASGRWVAFQSNATNLVPGDSNGASDIFVHDRLTSQTRRVSVASNGAQANGSSQEFAISADGRFVAFESSATNLVANDTNNRTDIFLHELQTGATTRVSVGAGGVEGNNTSTGVALSGDGRYIAFASNATNLVPGDSNDWTDVFVHDRLLGETRRVSVSGDGTQGNGFSAAPTISADGRMIAFHSNASTLVPGAAGQSVYVHDSRAGRTYLVSKASNGSAANGQSVDPAICSDGRFVVFRSSGTNLVAGDTNGFEDLFVRDLVTGTTSRVNLASDGTQANGPSIGGTLSADGRYVAFTSSATNLVPGDTNAFQDTFVQDRSSGRVVRVSVSAGGAQATGLSVARHLSADGRFIGFASSATNLVDQDTNGKLDSFVAGGVSVLPTAQSVSGAGGAGTAEVTFGYPGTSWSAASLVPWISITNQSTTTGNGTVTYAVAPNNAATPRTGTLTVALHTITVTQAGNAAPVAQDGTLMTAEDTPAASQLIATDPEGSSLTFSIVTNGTLGTAVLTDGATGTFTYTPNANANGTDSLTFRVNDGIADSNVATVSITVSAVNDAPLAIASAVTTEEDTPATGSLGAVDSDSLLLSFSILSNGAKGTAVVTNPATGAFTYTPNANANGTDPFTFAVSDGLSASAATVTVTITPGNDAPTAADGSLAATEDVQASGTLDASDVDGDALTLTIVSNGSKGTAFITDTATGAFTYTPNPDANGTDTFTFRSTDGTLQSNVSIVSVSIAAVNDAPAAQDGSTAAPKQSPVSGQLVATDVDGDPLTFTLVQQAAQGSVTVNTTGSYTYVSASNAGGTDQFTFRVSDGQAVSGVATVTVTILAGSGAPIAYDSTLSTPEDTSAPGTLHAVGQPGLQLTYTIENTGSLGTATITDVNTGAFTYTASPNASGADSFTFRVTDGSSSSNRATVSVTIAPVNDAPVASDGVLSVIEDRAESGMLIGSDVDGQALTFELVGAPLKGILAITNASTGRYTYTPNLNAHDADQFTFRVSDGIGVSNVATVTIAIAGVNDAPTAQDTGFSATVNMPLSATLPAADPDGDPLTYSVGRGPRRGTITAFDPSTGAFTYVPGPNFSGQDTFTFRVSDGVRNSQLATVTITIVP